MISSSEEENRTVSNNRPMAVLAICFCLWGLAELLFPPTGDSFDRTVPKLTHAAIMATCLYYTIADMRHFSRMIKFRSAMIFGGILSLILILFPIFSYDRMNDDLGPFLIQKFYTGCYTIEWYAVFLFCAVHIQIDPRSYRTFLKFIPVIFFFFFWAGHRLTNMNVKSVASEEFQNGIYAGYYIACFFPFIWDLSSRIFKFILFILLIYGVIYSMKRGAMLCLVSSLFLSFLTYYLFFAEGIKRIPYFFALSILLSIMIGVLVYSISMKRETFNHRMIDVQSGSGRIDLYKRTWATFKSLPPDEKATGTRTPSKQIRAHNDFRFVLICYGIVGCIFYILYDVGLLSICFHAVTSKFPMLPGLAAAIGNIAIIEMVSYGIEGHAFVICCAYVGIVQGSLISEQEEHDNFGEYSEVGDYDEPQEGELLFDDNLEYLDHDENDYEHGSSSVYFYDECPPTKNLFPQAYKDIDGEPK